MARKDVRSEELVPLLPPVLPPGPPLPLPPLEPLASPSSMPRPMPLAPRPPVPSSLPLPLPRPPAPGGFLSADAKCPPQAISGNCTKTLVEPNAIQKIWTNGVSSEPKNNELRNLYFICFH